MNLTFRRYWKIQAEIGDDRKIHVDTCLTLHKYLHAHTDKENTDDFHSTQMF